MWHVRPFHLLLCVFLLFTRVSYTYGYISSSNRRSHRSLLSNRKNLIPLNLLLVSIRPSSVSGSTKHSPTYPNGHCRRGLFHKCTTTKKKKYWKTHYYTDCPCSNCLLGYYQSEDSSSSNIIETCDRCPSGKYGEQDSMIACKDCESGKYNGFTSSTAETDCKSCGLGRFSTSKGAKICTMCSPGFRKSKQPLPPTSSSKQNNQLI